MDAGRRTTVVAAGVMITTASYLWFIHSRKQKIDEKISFSNVFKVNSQGATEMLNLERVASEDTEDSTDYSSDSPSTTQDEQESESGATKQARSVFLADDEKSDDAVRPVECATRSLDGTSEASHEEPVNEEIQEVKEREVPELKCATRSLDGTTEASHEEPVNEEIEEVDGTTEASQEPVNEEIQEVKERELPELEVKSREMVFEGYDDKIDMSDSADMTATKELLTKPMEMADIVAVLLVLVNIFLLSGINMS